MKPFDIQPLTQRFPFVHADAFGNALIVPAKNLVSIVEWIQASRLYLCDTLSNVTGVDFLPKVIEEEGKDSEGNSVKIKKNIPGYIEVVYHFYSIELKRGPLTIKVRSNGRDNVRLPSLMPHYRSAEFQEREIFDLYGVYFEGHYDLRRLLMWESFEDFPMRKDYVPPNDNEYEPIASRHSGGDA